MPRRQPATLDGRAALALLLLPIAITIVEWPSEKKYPMLSGRLPSLISLRVVLSMATMWSASNAWRRPRVYAVAATPIPRPLKCDGATNRKNTTNPATCNPTMTANINPTRNRSTGASAREASVRYPPIPNRPEPRGVPEQFAVLVSVSV